MITLDDIASIPHGEGKAVALTLWKKLRITDRALHEMCDTFEYAAPNGDKMYRAFMRLAAEQVHSL